MYPEIPSQEDFFFGFLGLVEMGFLRALKKSDSLDAVGRGWVELSVEEGRRIAAAAFSEELFTKDDPPLAMLLEDDGGTDTDVATFKEDKDEEDNVDDDEILISFLAALLEVLNASFLDEDTGEPETEVVLGGARGGF
jgi:hypothetical protein